MNNTDNKQVQFTENQRKAITTLGRNLCVTAGAGSGKTTVLVERYLYLIEKGELDIHEIAAITFTEKAANQMKEKIRGKIREKVEKSPDDQDREAWSRRYREIGSAWIHTIHGLCTRLLKENAIEAGVDPHFTTLDETETLVLIHETIRNFINERLDRGSDSMVLILSAYGLNETQRIFTQLLQQREKVSALSEKHQKQTDLEILEPLRDGARTKVASIIKGLKGLSCEDHEDKMEQLRQEVLSLLSGADLNSEILDQLRTLIVLRGGSKKKWGNGDLERVKALLRELKELSEKLLPLYDEKRARLELGLLRALLREFGRLDHQYHAEKNSQGVLDFDDLLILTRDLLEQNQGIRDRYRKEMKALLMDELQDTDPLQMKIVEHLCGDLPGRVFAVGDEKQSIYSFRGADVSVFQGYKEKIRRKSPDDVIPLRKNFRSQDKILNFINRLFSRVFPTTRQEEEDILFVGLEPDKGNTAGSHYVECCFIPRVKGEKNSVEETRREEARFLASRIQDMVENEEPRILDQGDKTRAVTYGDIAILFRAMTDVKIYEQALRRLGIPFTVVSGAGFFAKQEVQDVLNMLRLLLYPEDEEALAGFLRSPAAGVQDDTLFFMTRGRSLAQALEAPESIQTIDDHETRILLRTREMLRKLRRLRDRVTIPELIGRFLDETSIPALVLTDPVNGEQRYANLKKLMDLARDFSGKTLFGLSDFIAFMDTLKDKEAREAESPIDEETEDTVRILTVHKAKGLEFPVVFLPDLGRRSSGKTDPVLIHPDLGVGIKVPDDRGSFENSFIRSSILEHTKLRVIHEEKRLFYVAATRARDFLVLTGQIISSDDQKSDSTVPMDWFRDALGITAENCHEDIPYGDEKIKAYAPLTEEDPIRREQETWIGKFPAILHGEPVNIPEDTSARPLLERAAHAPVQLPPRRFTVSQLLLYRQCPRKYELSGLMGISEPAQTRRDFDRSGGRELGNLVHGILQRWDMDPSSLKECAERELNRSGLSPQDRKKMREQALKLARGFADTDTAEEIRSSAEVYTEAPFLLRLDRFHVEGVIDKLYRNPKGRLAIIDYKTDKVKKSEVPAKADAYGFQLATYALAANRLFSEPIETALVFLRPGITHPLPSDPDATEAEILSIIREIQSAATFTGNLDRCPKCGYRGPLCPAVE